MNVTPSSASISGPPAAESTARLAALRALQRAIEAQQAEEAKPVDSQDGKGRLLDLRC